jgi:hypothetical protein
MRSADVALILQISVRREPAFRRMFRPTLFQGELLRIPRDSRRLHVLSGTAWISAAGTDVILPPGSCAKLTRTRSPALVSALGGEPLLLEIW